MPRGRMSKAERDGTTAVTRTGFDRALRHGAPTATATATAPFDGEQPGRLAPARTHASR